MKEAPPVSAVSPALASAASPSCSLYHGGQAKGRNHFITPARPSGDLGTRFASSACSVTHTVPSHIKMPTERFPRRWGAVVLEQPACQTRLPARAVSTAALACGLSHHSSRRGIRSSAGRIVFPASRKAPAIFRVATCEQRSLVALQGSPGTLSITCPVGMFRFSWSRLKRFISGGTVEGGCERAGP